MEDEGRRFKMGERSKTVELTANNALDALH